MEFEDILEDVGSYGPFQRNLAVLFTGPVTILAPLLSMALVFVVTVPDHWCNAPELLPYNLSLFQQRSLIEAPENPSCLMRQLNYSNLNASAYDTIRCKDGWQYDRSDFDATAATKWNMVCQYSHYPSLILTLQSVGGLIGTPIYGSLADRLGRKMTFFIAVGVTSITEILSILTSSFVIFALLKTISGAIVPSMVLLPQMLVIELVRPDKRVQCSGIINTCWMIGMCVLPLIAYLSRSWITLGLVNTFAGAIIFLYWKYVPESPVWLISRERYEEALKVMLRIAKKNEKITEDEILLKKLKVLGERIKKKREEDRQSYCMYISKYPRLRKTFLIITFCWIANLIAYIGLQYNVINLEGNEFLNFFLLSVVEAPGNVFFWMMMERFGRRWSASIGFFLVSIVCMAPLTGFPYSETISSVVGKLIISGVFIVTDQQAFELFPTVIRSFGIGMSKTICKATSLLIPYIIYLGIYDKTIPFIIMAVLCVLAGILAAFLPESLNENLPQNISDAEEFGKDHKFFSLNRKNDEITPSSVPAKEKDIKEDPRIKVFVIKKL